MRIRVYREWASMVGAWLWTVECPYGVPSQWYFDTHKEALFFATSGIGIYS
jgi:hypothetical protein